MNTSANFCCRGKANISLKGQRSKICLYIRKIRFINISGFLIESSLLSGMGCEPWVEIQILMQCDQIARNFTVFEK
jgi:hypothetical protein